MEIHFGTILWYKSEGHYGIIVPDDRLQNNIIFFIDGYRPIVISEKEKPVFTKDCVETKNVPFPTKNARVIYCKSESAGKVKAFPWAYESNYHSAVNRLQSQLPESLYRIVNNNKVVWGDNGQSLENLCKEFPNYGVYTLPGIIQVNEGCGWRYVLREPRPMERKRYTGIPKPKEKK